VPQVAVVTGGSSGIGAAAARKLTEQGRLCVLIARGEERVRAVAEELGAEWETCDVGDREAVERTAAAIVERHPQIALLVNNAGIPGGGGFLRASAETIEAVTRTNYLGAVWCLRAFLPALEAAAPSDVVNVVSVVVQPFACCQVSTDCWLSTSPTPPSRTWAPRRAPPASTITSGSSKMR